MAHCECGCGAEVRRRYKKGHATRGRARSDGRGYTVDPETGCWVWDGATTDKGYGKLRRLGRVVRAHRYFYEQHVGPVPDGLELDHVCRNKRCVNPAHLEPVTHLVNIRRHWGLAVA